MKTFNEFINEKSGAVYQPKKNIPLVFKPHKNDKELKDEFFNLIQTAYAEIGGNIKVKTPDDVFKDTDWDYWEGEDLHGDKDFDIISFGKKTKYGIKFCGVGHDGEKESKREYLSLRAKSLKEIGNYIEVSGKLAAILIDKYKVPMVTDKKEIETILGKEIKWLGINKDLPGDSWYSRKIAREDHEKIMLGRPKI